MSPKLFGILRQVCLLPLLAAILPITLTAQVMQGPTTIRYNVNHDVSLPLSEMIKNAPPPDLTVHEAEPMKRIPLPPGLTQLTEDPAAAGVGAALRIARRSV